MEAAAIIDILQPLVPGVVVEPGRSVDFATIYVPADRLVDTCRALRDAPALEFQVLVEITAAGYLPRDPRYEGVSHRLSVSKRLRLRVKVRVPGEGSLPTVQGVWLGAGWLEREVWDMFGIVF